MLRESRRKLQRFIFLIWSMVTDESAGGTNSIFLISGGAMFAGRCVFLASDYDADADKKTNRNIYSHCHSFRLGTWLCAFKFTFYKR